MMLPRLVEHLVPDAAEPERLDAEELLDGTLLGEGPKALQHFRIRGLLPEWEFEVGGTRILKRMVLVHGENTLFVA